MYGSFGFNQLDHTFPMDVMMNLITITNNINCCSLARWNAESKILSLIIESTDKVVIRLLQCIKSMVESLPFIAQKKREIKEFLNFAQDFCNHVSKNYLNVMTIK